MFSWFILPWIVAWGISGVVFEAEDFERRLFPATSWTKRRLIVNFSRMRWWKEGLVCRGKLNLNF